MRLNLLYTIILALFLLSIFESKGQIPQFKNVKVLKGRNNYVVRSVFQDNTGYIWLGTTEGLVRYDGINYIIYNQKDSLADNNISSICVDKQNQLWVGHKNGKISILKKNKGFGRFNPPEGIGEKEISALFCDKAGRTWYTTLGEGVYYYENNRLFNINVDDGLTDNFCYCIAEDKNKNIWIGSDAGITIYNTVNKKVTTLSMKDGLPDNIVRSIVITADNKVWIGTDEGGICTYNIESKKFTTIPNWKFGAIVSLAFSDAQNLWIGTSNSGLINYKINTKTSQFQVFNVSNGLNDNRLHDVFCDREHNVWAGANNGATLCTGDQFSFLTEKQDTTFRKIYSQVTDQNNRIWFCSQSGLYFVEKDEFSHLTIKKALKNKPAEKYNFISLFRSNDNYIWAGTYEKGVLRINPETFEYQEYNTKNGLTGNNVISITGNKDLLVFTTLGNGISIYHTNKPDQFINFSMDNGLKSNYIYSAFIDNQNRIWLAQDGGGVSVIKGDKIIPFEKVNQLGNVIYAFAQDADQKIWMLAAGEGLFRFDGKNITELTTKNGLSSDFNQSIILDNNNNLLIVSNEGIDVLNTKDNSIFSYTEENGVAYLEPNLNAISKEKNGTIWIGTNKGLIKYKPLNSKDLHQNPYIAIARKRNLFSDISDEKNVFSYDENHLIFDYIGFWYKAPERLLYRYKLEGHDLTWRIETRSLTAVYSNLPDGEYTFRVEVSFSAGQWISSPEAIYSFKIRPPFWKTWWFIIFCILTLSMAIYFYITIRIAKLKRDKENLENEVIKRTTVITKQMEEIETQRDQIVERNQNITDSITYASRIQEAVLPPSELINEYLRDSFVFYKPKDIVSGDFYWISYKNNKIIVAVADCTGHGVPGAFMSMLGVTLLNEIVNKFEITTASEILDILRDSIKNSLRQTGQQDKTKDGMDISLCIIENDFKSLQFAGAYNSLYYVRNSQLTEIKADRMPIGVHYNESKSFSNSTLELQKNDMIYLFSDGFADQSGGEKQRKFLYKNFKALLNQIHSQNVNEQKQILQDTLNEYKGNLEQVDDILVMGFRI